MATTIASRHAWRDALTSERVIVAAGALVFVAWSVAFIYRSSVVVNGTRYFLLFDDAMVAMTHAQNFVDGYGLTWSRFGKPVEGFTCPLWTWLMIPIHWLPLSDATRPLLVQCLGLGCLLGNLAVVRAIAREVAPSSPAVGAAAFLLTAMYYPLAFWSLMGLDTSLGTLLTSSAVLLTLRARGTGSERLGLLCAVLTLALLLRLDLVTVVLACVVALARRGSLRIRSVGRWGPPALAGVVAVGTYFAFRVWYYGYPLPNTYYLKMTGVPLVVRVTRGLLVLFDFIRPQAAVWLMVLWASVRRARHHSGFRLLLAVFGLRVAFSVYVGGDVWEDALPGANRFIATAMPLYFVLLAALVHEGYEWLAERGTGLSKDWIYAVTLLLGVAHNEVLEPMTGMKRMRQAVHIDLPPYTQESKVMLKNALKLRNNLDRRARVAVVGAGISAYYTRFRMVDTLGYNDDVIAHGPAKSAPNRVENAEAFLPGHMKYDFDHTIGRLRPDVVYGLWKRARDEHAEALSTHGYVAFEDTWVRCDSPYVKRMLGKLTKERRGTVSPCPIE
ncbi:MAG: hypothetical protein JW751_26820 [Polyangiaceae bacterium]|nr:hypothetical protein [Polyangiaceae bacterium]